MDIDRDRNAIEALEVDDIGVVAQHPDPQRADLGPAQERVIDDLPVSLRVTIRSEPVKDRRRIPVAVGDEVARIAAPFLRER